MKEEILKGITWSEYPKRPTGGQSCGKISYGTTLKHEELEIEISVNIHRSQLKNKEEAFKLFESYIDALIFQNILGW
jgi:protein subunit release factor A